MAVPRVLVLRAAGINCNDETAYAFESAGAKAEQTHLNRLLEAPKRLDDFGCVAISGGFSYGDDVAAGKILAVELSVALGDALHRFVDRGGLVLGVCNGFQVLVKTGLLPGSAPAGERPVRATLAWNDSHRYEDRWVRLRTDATKSVFIEKDGVEIELPVAHGEGRFTVASDADLRALESDGRIALRYVSSDGGPAAYPANPNGSAGDVAALSDATGRILGLMPHPERFLFPYQHPRWTREPARAEGDGVSIFRAAVRALR
jgi:phosphoribosylformylglycinamidine synthase subunit PurQ / glutaminase